jgi:hypothetical protein
MPDEEIAPHLAALEDAKTKYGDARAVNTPAGWLVLRQPNKAEYDRWWAMQHNDREKPKGSEYIVRALRVFPDGPAFEQMLIRKPGICVEAMGAVNELVGITGQAEVKG